MLFCFISSTINFSLTTSLTGGFGSGIGSFVSNVTLVMGFFSGLFNKNEKKNLIKVPIMVSINTYSFLVFINMITNHSKLTEFLRKIINEEILIIEEKNEFKALKDNKVPLTDEERKKIMDADATWNHGLNGKPSPAVWKSVNPKTKEVTYVTNTHRAYNTAPTLKGAIGRYHKFIKGTA